jgi:hypothetical protein
MILAVAPSSSFDGHYTITDIVLAALVITPGVMFTLCAFFAQPLSEAIKALAERMRYKRESRRAALEARKARKFQLVGRSKWHGKN